MNVITVDNVSKVYRLYDCPTGRLKEALFRGKRKYHTDYWALRDISFSVKKGTTLGIIGRNGSGKSTLLQIIAKILMPTIGNSQVHGRISALLELGSGFDPEFTGRENVYLNGSILGLTSKDIDNRIDDIIAFADIGSYMDQPVKRYSSGMYVRLAFATAVNVDPDILLVDEALAVGDIVFQHRCMRKIREIQEQGKTILFVSHDISAVRKLCTEAILLDKGRAQSIGPPDEVIQAYYKAVWHADEPPEFDSQAVDPTVQTTSESAKRISPSLVPVEKFDKRFGNRNGEIVAVGLTDEYGNSQEAFTGNQWLNFSILVKCHKSIDMPLVGFVLKDLLGNELIMTNTDANEHYLQPCPVDSLIQVSFTFVLPPLKPGSYAISAGFGNGTIENHRAYDWIENIVVFVIESSTQFYGLFHVDFNVHSELINENKKLVN